MENIPDSSRIGGSTGTDADGPRYDKVTSVTSPLTIRSANGRKEVVGNEQAPTRNHSSPSTSSSTDDEEEVTLSLPAIVVTDADAIMAQIHMGNADEHVIDSDNSTAEIAANSPRYRRRSSTFIDGVHDVPDDKASPMAPAQLYSTMSGRLFHSGRIAIVLVGPPARGKT